MTKQTDEPRVACPVCAIPLKSEDGITPPHRRYVGAVLHKYVTVHQYEPCTGVGLPGKKVSK